MHTWGLEGEARCSVQAAGHVVAAVADQQAPIVHCCLQAEPVPAWGPVVYLVKYPAVDFGC